MDNGIPYDISTFQSTLLMGGATTTSVGIEV